MANLRADLRTLASLGQLQTLERPAGALGQYLALTGARLTSPADLLHARLATHYVPRAQLPRLRAALAAAALPENPGGNPGGVAGPPTAGGSGANDVASAQRGKEAALAAVLAVVADFQVLFLYPHCVGAGG